MRKFARIVDGVLERYSGILKVGNDYIANCRDEDVILSFGWREEVDERPAPEGPRFSVVHSGVHFEPDVVKQVTRSSPDGEDYTEDVIESYGRVVHDYRQVENPVTVDDYDRALEDHLTQARMARGYTTREPDAYANSSNPRWRQDAEDWLRFRDACMEAGLSIMNDYAAGKPVKSLDEFVASLPEIVWTYKDGDNG